MSRNRFSAAAAVASYLLVGLGAGLGAGPAPARAQQPQADVQAVLQVTPPGEAAPIGGDLVLDLVLAAPPGQAWRPGSWTVAVVASGEDGGLGEPYPLRVLEPAPDAGDAAPPQRVHLEWAAPVPPEAQAGPRALEVRAEAVTAEGRTLAASWRGTVTLAYGSEWSADRITAFIERRGLAPFLALVFGFGVLMSLSPCIYPMIPITLAVIGGQSQGKGAWRGLGMSVTYVVGMAAVYAVLGALSATVFSGITAFMQSPAVLVPIALLMLFLAFSMFGAYELQAPAFLRDRLQGPGGGRGGLLGVFVMGMVAGLVASPCVGPFLAALLVWVGTTGSWLLGLVSLFTFGIGMGLLLIGVGTFPALLGSLPRSGGWMDVVKKAMGLVLVGMAFWFVRPPAVLSPAVFRILVAGSAIVLSVFLGAFDAMGSGASWWDRTRKGLGLIAFAAGLCLLAGFLLGLPAGQGGHQAATAPAAAAAGRTATAPAAQPQGAAQASAPAKVAWEVVKTGQDVGGFLQAQRQAAAAAGKPMMIDFWAQWCVYCKKLDKLVWSDPGVAAESSRVVTVKVDATEPDDADMEAVKEQYGVPGLPRVVFIDSRGQILAGRSTGFQEAGAMLQTMRAVR